MDPTLRTVYPTTFLCIDLHLSHNLIVVGGLRGEDLCGANCQTVNCN